MRRKMKRFAGLTLVTVSLLAACTTPPASDPLSTTSPTDATSSMTPTTIKPPSVTASSATATPSSQSRIPEAARANTADGAVAFATFFIAQANAAYKELDLSAVSGLYSAQCKACNAMAGYVESWKTKGYRYTGNFATPTFITASAFPGDNSGKVLLQSKNPPAKVIDSTGSTIETIAAEVSTSSIFLTFADGGWTVEEIKVAA